MSIFPVTPLVRHVQKLILQTFDISKQDAQDYAAEMVALAEGWGSPEHAQNLDWPNLVKRNLGTKFKWKSEDERTAFVAERSRGSEVYDFFIEKRKRSKYI